MNQKHHWLLPVGMIVFFFLLFYLPGVFHGGKFLPGDIGDGRFNALVAASYADVLSGDLKLGEQRMFYPNNFVLGNSDASIFNGLATYVISKLGIHPFVAQAIVLYAMHLAGAFGWYLFARKYVGLSVLSSLLVVWFGVFGNANAQLLQQHTQFYMFSAVPYFFMLVWEYLKARDFATRLGFLLMAETLFMLIFFSAYYVAFFVVFSTMLYLFFAFLQHRFLLKDFLYKKLFAFLKERWKDIGIALVAAVPGGLLFHRIYYPLLAENRTWTWSCVRGQLPEWSDFFNVSDNNLLWGKLYHYWFPGATMREIYWELEFGLTPVAAALGAAGVLYILCRWRKKSTFELLAWPLAATILACMILMLRFHEFYGGLWIFVWYTVPGANAVRSVFRLWVYLLPWILLVGGRLLDEFWNRLSAERRKRYAGVLFLFLVLCLVGEFNAVGPCRWSMEEARKRIAHIPAPPPGTKAFFVTDSSGRIDPFCAAQLDAMQLALRDKLFPLNGYSGVEPAENWPFKDLHKGDIVPKAIAYFRCRRPGESLYSCDLTTGQWTRRIQGEKP
ncbi:MAG: hypothetical protein PHS41_04705 [Victivallaceae bacterium]|nr:hypothetical protein [Victivallaceae bacterium]